MAAACAGLRRHRVAGEYELTFPVFSKASAWASQPRSAIQAARISSLVRLAGTGTMVMADSVPLKVTT